MEKEERKQEIRENLKVQDDYDPITDVYRIMYKVRVPMIVTKEKIVLYHDILKKLDFQPIEKEGVTIRRDKNTIVVEYFTLGTQQLMCNISKELHDNFEEKAVYDINLRITKWIEDGEIKEDIMDYPNIDSEDMIVYGEKTYSITGCLWDVKQ